jgi:hypothetical protein
MEKKCRGRGRQGVGVSIFNLALATLVPAQCDTTIHHVGIVARPFTAKRSKPAALPSLPFLSDRSGVERERWENPLVRRATCTLPHLAWQVIGKCNCLASWQNALLAESPLHQVIVETTHGGCIVACEAPISRCEFVRGSYFRILIKLERGPWKLWLARLSV